MARSLIIYLNRKDVPVRKPLQAAVDELGFKVTLDHAYAPFETEGYLPCTLDGEDAGFDLRFQEVAEDASVASLEGRDASMKFRWAGDPREQLAALTVCAALVKQFGALAFEPEKDKLLSLNELLAKARDAQESL